MIIRSFIFWFVTCFISICVPIIFFPVFFTKKTKYADKIATQWVTLIIYLLKVICKIDYKILGKENLPKGACVIACKHQSMWETLAMVVIFDSPAPIYKKEILRVPFFGWFLGRTSAIKVDREGATKALRSIVAQAKQYTSEGRNIIIFPQGTRVPVGMDVSKYKYQSGVAALYLNCKVPVVPAALDSGLFWNKKNLLLKKGTVTLQFLPAINPGLEKREFMKKLEEQIEEGSQKLL